MDFSEDDLKRVCGGVEEIISWRARLAEYHCFEIGHANKSAILQHPSTQASKVDQNPRP